jgi:hypothetical protein
MSQRKLKVLALHSWRTSGKIFTEQMLRAGLDKSLADLVDIVYIDSPNPASGPIPDDVKPYFEGPYYEWWNAEKDEERNIWRYHGVEKSIPYVCDILRLHGPFDGLIGFSQGGCLTSVLIGLQRYGKALQDVPPLQFCIIFAGVPSRDKTHQHMLQNKIDCPSVHIIGDKDGLRKYSDRLVEGFVNPIVIRHPRGHVIPALDAASLEVLRAYLQAQLQSSSL